MLLHYPSSHTQMADVLVLENARGWRIEMYLKANQVPDSQALKPAHSSSSYSLIALSGVSHLPAELNKAQGPYETREQASAARSAIAQQLLNKDFEVQHKAEGIWSLQAQKAIRQMRAERNQHQGNYHFHPDDVL